MNYFLYVVDMFYQIAGMNLLITGSGKRKDKDHCGLFSKDGTIGIIESKEYRNIKTFLPFLGSIWDQTIDPCSSILLKSVFSSYINLVNQAYRHGLSQNWNDEELDSVTEF